MAVAHAHQANGTVERAIRGMSTIGRSRNAPPCVFCESFWVEAAMAAVCIENRLPSHKVETERRRRDRVQDQSECGGSCCSCPCLAYVLTQKRMSEADRIATRSVPELRRTVESDITCTASRVAGGFESRRQLRWSRRGWCCVRDSTKWNCGSTRRVKIAEENVRDAHGHRREFKSGGKAGVAQPGDVSSDSECVDSATMTTIYWSATAFGTTARYTGWVLALAHQYGGSERFVRPHEL